jgi:hypothetical protein
MEELLTRLKENEELMVDLKLFCKNKGLTWKLFVKDKLGMTKSTCDGRIKKWCDLHNKKIDYVKKIDKEGKIYKLWKLIDIEPKKDEINEPKK